MFGSINQKIPPFRKLRGYAFDPSLSLKIDTALINDLVYKITWEEQLKPGPVGEYIEVVDFDPTAKKFYRPVSLNDQYVLAQDGLTPSESDPQFHQQMVYAVCMTTIKNFERALGRPVFWSPHGVVESSSETGSVASKGKKGNPVKKTIRYDYVPRLRIYPHAFRDANAYYSPQKKALLFGYFSAQPAELTMQMPNSIVFTCLSHDIIAHETTHAILDGMYRRYIEPTNPDVLAFHEAFADIVALFQHFTFPEVLKHQIAKTRGDLTAQNLLGQLAQEFGTAVGQYGALRDAIGYTDEETHQWHIKVPNGDEYQTATEAHDRGAILVSAVFDAFLAIYKSRITDLLKIASGGSGILPVGELQSDLVNRLATEASRSARHVLGMCIRALDYCPPVDITFGDYLRAIITADVDLMADDPLHYRVAFIDAFRKRGVYPTGIRNLSIESLSYAQLSIDDLKTIEDPIAVLTEFLRLFWNDLLYVTERKKIFDITGDYIRGRYEDDQSKIVGLHRRLNTKFRTSQKFTELTGLVFNQVWESLGIHTAPGGGPSFEVHSLKVASRVSPDGSKSNQIIMTLIQRAGIESVTENDSGGYEVKTFVAGDDPDLSVDRFIMTGGCTLIFDLKTLQLKYAISKPLLNLDALRKNGKYEIDAQRAARISESMQGIDVENMYEAYFGMGRKFTNCEPFSFLHQH
jgi:hypothetical protein